MEGVETIRKEYEITGNYFGKGCNLTVVLLSLYINKYNMEIWKEVENSKGYAVSSYGRVKRLERRVWCSLNKSYSNYKEKILKLNANNSKNYLRIRIVYNKYIRVEQVHRLVAKAFIDNSKNLPQVNHKDGNRLNNHYLNLEWVTGSENMRHRIDVLGIKHWRTGKECNFGKLTELQVRQLPELLKTNTRASAARMFKVSSTTISEIVNGRSWQHLNLEFPKAFYRNRGLRYSPIPKET